MPAKHRSPTRKNKRDLINDENSMRLDMERKISGLDLSALTEDQLKQMANIAGITYNAKQE